MIRLCDITKTYTMGSQSQTVLDHVSLTIEQGEFVAIMGPSGSGKSTMMNIIGMLDVMTSGEYFFLDHPLHTYSDSRLSSIRSEHIGFVFQGYNLIKRTSAIDQVLLPLTYQGVRYGEARDRAMAALDRVGLADKYASSPSELSGGQQQRVAIARSLVINPALLLCDEPTGALDSQTTEDVMALFCSLHEEGSTIVMITHDQEVADYASRCIMLRDGKIVSS